MKTEKLLFVAPHLDDVAFSCGPAFSEHAEVHVATVFTATVESPTGFALACQLNKGLAKETDYMAIRRAEDQKWAETIGVAKFFHGPFREAPHRGYENVKMLFGDVRPEDSVGHEIAFWLREIIGQCRPDRIFFPLAIGNHVDHQILKTVARKTVCSEPVSFYINQPYAAKNRSQTREQIRDLQQLSWGQPQMIQPQAERALAAASAYATQIPFQFGSVTQMKELLTEGWRQFPFWIQHF